MNSNGVSRFGNFSRLLLLAMLALLPSSAFAHSGHGAAGGFISGFSHPSNGLDHMVAMVAVGLWGAFFENKTRWLLPALFPLVMAFGGVLGFMGIPLPSVETGIALSGAVLGTMVALAARPTWRVAATMIAIFAVFHGHAHGTELPEAANPVTYSLGFVISTGLMHLTGMALGCLSRWPWGLMAVRAGGAGISLVGCAFLFGVL